MPSREPTPVEATDVEPRQSDEDQLEGNDDAASEASSGLPRALISGLDYESFVCGACVSGIDTLRRWAGTDGTMMVVRDNPSDPWKVLTHSCETEDSKVADLDVVDDGSASSGGKRPRAYSPTSAPDPKRLRSSPSPSSSCLAPPPNPIAQKIFSLRDSPVYDMSLGAGDVFLTDGWRERWCRCNSVRLRSLMMI